MIIPPTNLVELLNIPARDYVIYARDLFLYEKKKKRPTKKKKKKRKRNEIRRRICSMRDGDSSFLSLLVVEKEIVLFPITVP